MIKVISFKICPFFQHVMAYLHARQIPHEVEYTVFDDCRFDVSPTGKAPILITEPGETLFESEAIIDYLEARYPDADDKRSLEQKALDRAWSHYGSKHYVPQCSAMRSEDAGTLAERVKVLDGGLAKMEGRLAGQRFFHGDKPGPVDIAWSTLLYRAALLEKHSGYDFLAAFPALKAWQHALLAEDFVARSVSADFEAVFTGFYLSDVSYLARQ